MKNNPFGPVSGAQVNVQQRPEIKRLPMPQQPMSGPQPKPQPRANGNMPKPAPVRRERTLRELDDDRGQQMQLNAMNRR